MGSTAIRKAIVLALLSALTFTVALGCGDGKKRKQSNLRGTFVKKNTDGKKRNGADKHTPGDQDADQDSPEDTDGTADTPDSSGDPGPYTKDQQAEADKINGQAESLLSAGTAIRASDLTPGTYKLTKTFSQLIYTSTSGAAMGYSGSTVDGNGDMGADAVGSGTIGEIVNVGDSGREIEVPRKFSFSEVTGLSEDGIQKRVYSTIVNEEGAIDDLTDASAGGSYKATASIVDMASSQVVTGNFNGKNEVHYKGEDGVQMSIRRISLDQINVVITIEEEANLHRRLFFSYERSNSRDAEVVTTGEKDITN